MAEIFAMPERYFIFKQAVNTRSVHTKNWKKYHKHVSFKLADVGWQTAEKQLRRRKI